MTDHTTVQITKTQAEELAERKQYDAEPYKSVIARLLNGDGQTADLDTDEIADAVADRLDTGSDVQLDTADILGRIEDLESQLPQKVSQELQR